MDTELKSFKQRLHAFVDENSAARAVVLTSRGIKNFFNDPLVKGVIGLGYTVADAWGPFAEKPNTWNAVRAVASILNSLVDEWQVWGHDYFTEDEDAWVEPFPDAFNAAITEVLQRYPSTVIRTNDEDLLIYIHDVNGARVGYQLDTRHDHVPRTIYAETANVETVREVIRKRLWERYNSRSLVMTRNATLGFNPNGNRDSDWVTFEEDNIIKPLPSQRASDYSTYLKKCIDAGVNRSVMLYGPPGTGKSTMARMVVDTLGLTSFRIRVEDVSSGINLNTVLFEAVKIFKPDAIILDDFDRAHGQESLMEMLERFNKDLKLVIATVNRRYDLDEALLRPGRFDELQLVKKLDDNVIRKVLGEYEDAFDLVKDWPIVFIDEFVKRRRFMDKDEAAESILELAARVERLHVFDEDEGAQWSRLKHISHVGSSLDDEDWMDCEPQLPVRLLSKEIKKLQRRPSLRRRNNRLRRLYSKKR